MSVKHSPVVVRLSSPSLLPLLCMLLALTCVGGGWDGRGSLAGLYLS